MLLLFSVKLVNGSYQLQMYAADQSGECLSFRSLCVAIGLYLLCVTWQTRVPNPTANKANHQLPQPCQQMFLELLEIRRQYEYTITNFSTIRTNLRHIVVLYLDYVWDKDKQALKLLGVFVGDNPVVLPGSLGCCGVILARELRTSLP